MLNFIRSLSNLKVPIFSSFSICFDMGTNNTRIGIKGKGKVLSEPTYIGYNSLNKEYIFFGKEAQSIIGKTPDFIKIISPVGSGVISDFDAQTVLMRHFLEKSADPYLKPYLIIKPQLHAIAAIPKIATEIEQKAVEEVLAKVGMSNVKLIENSIASAIGSGVNVFHHRPHLLAHLGGGLIELSIISGGGIVVEKTLKTAGNHMNHVLYNYVYLKHGVILGEQTCEKMKTSLMSFEDEGKTLMVRGKSLENGLPKSVRVKSADVKEALLTNFMHLVDALKELIEISPPEVVDEVYTNGILLSGGLANIKGIDRFFAGELKIDVQIAEQPSDSVILGLLKISSDFDSLNRLSISSR
ncbi:rod shape-determining protein [Candidatus Roizmanbacteria bacterium]|nr:rod shape-determining protein [Candidatus Roizmanbacteria bacterium]